MDEGGAHFAAFAVIETLLVVEKDVVERREKDVREVWELLVLTPPS